MIKKETLVGFLMLPLAITMLILNAGCEDPSGGESSGSDNKTIITQAEFNQIQDGMTHARVVDIIGSDGDLSGESEHFRDYTWQNPDGSAAVVSFMDDQVVSKGASGKLP